MFVFLNQNANISQAGTALAQAQVKLEMELTSFKISYIKLIIYSFIRKIELLQH